MLSLLAYQWKIRHCTHGSFHYSVVLISELGILWFRTFGMAFQSNIAGAWKLSTPGEISVLA